MSGNKAIGPHHVTRPQGDNSMSGNKAMRRALETKDAYRLGTNLPLITDETEFITPDKAKEYLLRNHHNRPVNFRKMDEYVRIMKAGKWELHSQGIIFDEKGDLLTGQTRLYAVVHSGVGVYMRVSRGNPRRIVNLLDRGRPQSARDLAARATGRGGDDDRISPLEASIARAMCVLEGTPRPSIDQLGDMIARNSDRGRIIVAETKGKQKTRGMMMILAAVCFIAKSEAEVKQITIHSEQLAEKLETVLMPHKPEKCWGKGVAFSMAMEQARLLVTPIIAGLCKKPN